jgi:hypothetical protein
MAACLDYQLDALELPPAPKWLIVHAGSPSAMVYRKITRKQDGDGQGDDEKGAKG